MNASASSTARLPLDQSLSMYFTKYFPASTPPNRNTAAIMPVIRSGAIPMEPEVTLSTKESTSRPSMSSITAAPTMICANLCSSKPNSLSRATVTPTLVAVSAAPRNME